MSEIILICTSYLFFIPNQLYAQSLRGDNKSNHDHSEAVKPELSVQNNWWLVLLAGGIGGGAIVAAAFWLGRRSGTKMVILREPSKIPEHIDR